MKRTYFPGITDIVIVTDPVEIRTVSNESRIDRDFAGHGGPRRCSVLIRSPRVIVVWQPCLSGVSRVEEGVIREVSAG